MKLPRLPHPGNILDAKYTKEQMHAYAMKAIALACDRFAFHDGNTYADLVREEFGLIKLEEVEE